MDNSLRCRVMTVAFYMSGNQQADHNHISSSTKSHEIFTMILMIWSMVVLTMNMMKSHTNCHKLNRKNNNPYKWTG